MEAMNRRTFIAKTAMATAGVALEGSASRRSLAADAPMKLSLSVTMAEGKRTPPAVIEPTMPFDAFLAMAKSCGYQAISMRGSQAGVDTPIEKLREMGRMVRAQGLQVSRVMPDSAEGINSDYELSTHAIRHITPYLNYAEAFHCNMIRVMVWKDPDDIVSVQRACDEARERKIRLVHNSHLGTLFETVNGAIATLKKVNRPNFGINLEPSLWVGDSHGYGIETIKRISPWLMDVELNNMADKPGSRGLGLWEKGAVDSVPVFEGLYAIHYSGWVTAFGGPVDGMTPQETARKTYEYLKPYATHTAKIDKA